MDKPKILYTGTHYSRYADRGYVWHMPLIEIAPLDDYSPADKVIGSFTDFDWLVFTSVHAVRFFFKRFAGLQFTIGSLQAKHIASIGSYTTRALEKLGVTPELQAREESSEGLVSAFKQKNIKQKSILLPRSDKASQILPEGLSGLNNRVTCLEIYQTKLPENIELVDPEEFDQIIFTSPSGIENYLKIYEKFPTGPLIITKGKETEKALLGHGYQRKLEK